MKRHFCALFTTVSLIAALPVLISSQPEPIANYRVFFSPDDAIADELISLIEKETKSVKVAVYSLMHQGIVKALMDAHKRGVDVQVVVDPFSVKARSPVKKMDSANLPVFVWNASPSIKEVKGWKRGVKESLPLMHDKFCILGDDRVWTGSFNFTFQASQSNKENVIVLESAAVASRYLEEFEKLKKTGCVTLKEYLLTRGGVR